MSKVYGSKSLWKIIWAHFGGKEKKCVGEWKDGKNEKKEGRNSKRGERKKVLEQGKRVFFVVVLFILKSIPHLCVRTTFLNHTLIHP